LQKTKSTKNNTAKSQRSKTKHLTKNL